MADNNDEDENKNKDNVIPMKGGSLISQEAARIRNRIKKAQEPAEIDEEAVAKVRHKNRALEEAENKQLRLLNTNHAYVRSIGGKPYVTHMMYDDFRRKEIMEFITPDSFCLNYCNEYAEATSKNGKDVLMPLGKWWIGCIHRKEYETVT